MSDGPYRSLQMSRAWKRLAEFAENANFDHADTATAAMHALASAWKNEVLPSLSKGLCGIFLDTEPSLFRDAHITQAQALSNETASFGLGHLLAIHAIAVLEDGMHGEAGLIEVVQRALSAYGARTVRQIEEHYCRRASTKLTKQVRERITEAVGTINGNALAKQCLGLVPKTSSPRVIKHTGLDKGVPL